MTRRTRRRAAPARPRGTRPEATVGTVSMASLRVVAATFVTLSIAAAAAQMIPLPTVVRATVTVAFALTVPGAVLVAVVLLCGAGVARGGAVALRLQPAVLAALVVPVSVAVLIATAQIMLWTDTWRPSEAMVLLAGLGIPVLLATVVSLTRSGGAEADEAAPTTDQADRERQRKLAEMWRTGAWPS